MDTSTDIEAIIRETAKLAALESARAVLKEQAQKAAGRADRRLHNTKLLLKNYRMFKKHCTGAVYTDESGEHDGSEEETALELLDMMLQRNNAITVESIRNSCRRTIKAMYIDETAKPVEQIAMQENVSARQVYRDHDAAVDKISMLMFGIDGLELV